MGCILCDGDDVIGDYCKVVVVVVMKSPQAPEDDSQQR